MPFLYSFVRSNDTPYDKRNYGEIIRTSDAFILNLDYFILISLLKYNVHKWTIVATR